jgi:large subunit ribosomal protein L24
MNKIRKNDEVIVLTVKTKVSAVRCNHCMLIVMLFAGVNVAKKAVKPNPMTGAVGGIVDK